MIVEESPKVTARYDIPGELQAAGRDLAQKYI